MERAVALCFVFRGDQNEALKNSSKELAPRRILYDDVKCRGALLRLLNGEESLEW